MSEQWISIPVNSIRDVVIDEGSATAVSADDIDQVRGAFLQKIAENDDDITILGLRMSDLPPAFQSEEPEVRLVISARRKRIPGEVSRDEAFCGLAFYSRNGLALTAPYLVCDHGIPNSLWQPVLAMARAVGLSDPNPDEPLLAQRPTMRGARGANDASMPPDPHAGHRWQTTPFEAATLN